jgi:hypothetical protein
MAEVMRSMIGMTGSGDMGGMEMEGMEMEGADMTGMRVSRPGER